MVFKFNQINITSQSHSWLTKPFWKKLISDRDSHVIEYAMKLRVEEEKWSKWRVILLKDGATLVGTYQEYVFLLSLQN
jgi:hypothetical protein